VREAAEKGVRLHHHAAHLIVHGLLHLVGYDHERSDEAQVMEALETRILATMGIADPYRENARAD
jgi:probable rRNA maturation factor